MTSRWKGPVVWVGRGPGGNYVAKHFDSMNVEELKGKVVAVSVQHDGWCGVFNGRACDCDPDITTTTL